MCLLHQLLASAREMCRDEGFKQEMQSLAAGGHPAPARNTALGLAGLEIPPELSPEDTGLAPPQLSAKPPRLGRGGGNGLLPTAAHAPAAIPTAFPLGTEGPPGHLRGGVGWSRLSAGAAPSRGSGSWGAGRRVPGAKPPKGNRRRPGSWAAWGRHGRLPVPKRPSRACWRCRSNASPLHNPHAALFPPRLQAVAWLARKSVKPVKNFPAS